VVLGASSDSVRAQESLKLLNYGFQFYDAVQLYAKNEAGLQPEGLEGQGATVKAGLHRTIS
jgi:D-alanyl-D-alanine carboxypeptidase (penicillin-binding protein 5/6)